MDAIGNCVFGINMNTMNDEDNEFRKQGKMIFEGSIENLLRLRLKMFLPRLYDLLGFVWPDRKIAPFFIKLVAEMMRYRKENNVHRPDFIHLLMELRDHPEKLDELELTDQLLTAQAYMFFAAGHESTSTTMGWALLELARNQAIQDKLRKEIKQYMEKYNGDITYETVKEMEYLDKVFKGMRFAIFKWKLGMLKILVRCKVEICEQTKDSYEYNPKAFLLAPEDDI